MWFSLFVGILSVVWYTRWWIGTRDVQVKQYLMDVSQFRMSLLKDLSNVDLMATCGDWIRNSKGLMVDFPSYSKVLNQSMYETGLYCLLAESTIALQNNEAFAVDLSHWLSQY